ncbi:MAG: AI-2E family transporter [Clostridia bacterium]|nr:AI-2E family transporter [Clostridia bacterium]MBR4458579.1 AI-2E family transporter [Clostridia bacterium]
MTPQRRAFERLLVRISLLIFFVLLIWWLAPVLWRYMSPFIISIPLASMINPISRFLEKKLHFRHSPAVMVPVIALLLLVLAAIVWVISYGTVQLQDLMTNSSSIITDGLNNLRDSISKIIDRLPSDLISNDVGITERTNAVIAYLGEQLTPLARNAAKQLLEALKGTPYALIYVNFLAMGLYQIAKEYDEIISFLPHKRKSMRNSSAATVSTSAITGAVGYLKVQFIYAVISFVAGIIFWNAVGNPYAVLISVVAATLEFIPIVGNGTIYIPWALIALILGDVEVAWQPAVLYAVLFLIRRLSEPRVMSHNIGVSPLLSLIGMFVGMEAGGIFGLIMGPVLTAVLVAIWKAGYWKPIVADMKTVALYLKERWADSRLIPAFPDAPAPAAPETPSAPAEEIPPAPQEPSENPPPDAPAEKAGT